MADDLEPLGEAELVEGLEKKSLSGKKLVVIIGGLIVVAALAFAVMSLMGGDDDKPVVKTEADELDEQAKKETPVKQEIIQEKIEDIFVPVTLDSTSKEQADITVPLNTGPSGGSAYLSVGVYIVVDRKSYQDDIVKQMPRIYDDIITYLRELRVEDVEGNSGSERLREEIMSRINQSVAPTRVKEVLFTKMVTSSG